MNATKGIRIETLALVAKTGSSCSGMMPFETPFVRLSLPGGTDVLWHSDRAGVASHELRAGDEVAVSGFLYGTRLRRVTIAKGCRVWGIGGL